MYPLFLFVKLLRVSRPFLVQRYELEQLEPQPTSLFTSTTRSSNPLPFPTIVYPPFVVILPLKPLTLQDVVLNIYWLLPGPFTNLKQSLLTLTTFLVTHLQLQWFNTVVTISLDHISPSNFYRNSPISRPNILYKINGFWRVFRSILVMRQQFSVLSGDQSLLTYLLRHELVLSSSKRIKE